jgi:hypothetical protein
LLAKAQSEEVNMSKSLSLVSAVSALLFLGLSNAFSAEYLTGEFPKSTAYSPAVIKGGKTIWLAGEGGNKDSAGNDILGNIEAQTKLIFEVLERP